MKERLETPLITKELIELKTKIHLRLLEVVDLSIVDTLDRNTLRLEIGKITERILSENNFSIPMNSAE